MNDLFHMEHFSAFIGEDVPCGTFFCKKAKKNRRNETVVVQNYEVLRKSKKKIKNPPTKNPSIASM